MGFPLKSILKATAPWLATAIGGPLAGAAVAKITGALGMDSGSKVEDIEAQIAAGNLTGEQLLKLKEADQEFQRTMAIAGFENIQKLESLAAEDRDSARKREIEVKDVTPRLLAAGVTAGFFGILLFMLLKPVPAETHDVLMVMIGSLGTAWTAVISYYFGSSAGSAAKTALMAKSAEQAADK